MPALRSSKPPIVPVHRARYSFPWDGTLWGGAFLFNGPNGTIRVGEVKVGQEGQVTDMAKDAPEDAIGMIHTHPTVQGANGMTFPGGPPSGGDAAIVKSENINGVVESKEARYFQPWENPGIYITVERP
jgi:hypothetical protein